MYPAPKVAQISWDPETNSITPDTKLPGWVFNTKLVAKPDQLIKRRGKAGLLALNKTWEEAKPWIAERAGKPQKVCFARRPCSLRECDTIDAIVAISYRCDSYQFTSFYRSCQPSLAFEQEADAFY